MNALTSIDTDVLIDATLQISKAIGCLDGLEQNSMLDAATELNWETRNVFCNDSKCSS
jgi:hypothetical protein